MTLTFKPIESFTRENTSKNKESSLVKNVNRLRDIEHRKTFRIKVSNSRRRGYHPRVYYTHYPDDILEPWQTRESGKSSSPGGQCLLGLSRWCYPVSYRTTFKKLHNTYPGAENSLSQETHFTEHWWPPDMISLWWISLPLQPHAWNQNQKNRCGLDNKKCMKTEHSRKQIQKKRPQRRLHIMGHQWTSLLGEKISIKYEH